MRQALWVQFGNQEFHSATEGMKRLLDAVLFKQPQYAIRIGGTSYIDGVVGSLFTAVR